MELLPVGTKFNFMGKSKIAFVFSALLIAMSVWVWIDRGQSKYGIDYAGGYEIIASIPGEVSTNDLRKLLKKKGVKEAVVQSFEVGSEEYAIRIPIDSGLSEDGGAEATNQVRGTVASVIQEAFGESASIVGTDYVGPTISEELKEKAVTAVIVGLLGILGYITVRFEFAFALGAVAALFHDVIVCMGIYLITGKTLTMATLAGALTIVGYSVNDTIIVFDRIREEFLRGRKLSIPDLMNLSINLTLSRTVITSLLTLFSAVALLVFGGGAIVDLSLFLVIGVIAGTYSTIFIASPVALAWEEFRARSEEKGSNTATSAVL